MKITWKIFLWEKVLLIWWNTTLLLGFAQVIFTTWNHWHSGTDQLRNLVARNSYGWNSGGSFYHWPFHNANLKNKHPKRPRRDAIPSLRISRMLWLDGLASRSPNLSAGNGKKPRPIFNVTHFCSNISRGKRSCRGNLFTGSSDRCALLHQSAKVQDNATPCCMTLLSLAALSATGTAIFQQRGEWIAENWCCQRTMLQSHWAWTAEYSLTGLLLSNRYFLRYLLPKHCAVDPYSASAQGLWIPKDLV